jgi:hypothetical protein
MAVELPQMIRIRDDFVKQMHAGLATENGSSLPMIPTLVDVLPDGYASYFRRHNFPFLHAASVCRLGYISPIYKGLYVIG